MESPQSPDGIDRSAGAKPERRRVIRRGVPLSGRWHADGRWIHVVVENISPLGAALGTVVPLSPGQEGQLRLEGLDLSIPCAVCWATHAVAGVRFTLTATETAEVSAHIDRHAAKARILMPWALDPVGST